jgi:hypothetical protein
MNFQRMALSVGASRIRLFSVVLAASLAVGMASAPVRAQEAVGPGPGPGAAESAGSILLGAGFGPAFAISGFGTGFHLELNASYAFKERLWGVFTPSFVFVGGGTLITLPVGVQYDIMIPQVPNLYVYLRGSIGVGIFAGGGGNAAFAIIPEAGIKYNIEGKYFIGFEPFSLPIYIGDGTATLYRLNFVGGLYL